MLAPRKTALFLQEVSSQADSTVSQAVRASPQAFQAVSNYQADSTNTQGDSAVPPKAGSPQADSNDSQAISASPQATSMASQTVSKSQAGSQLVNP